jgi:hypothetical protein
MSSSMATKCARPADLDLAGREGHVDQRAVAAAQAGLEAGYIDAVAQAFVGAGAHAGVGPRLQLGAGAALGLAGGPARQLLEGGIDLGEAQVVQPAHHHGHRRLLEHGREALQCFAQRTRGVERVRRHAVNGPGRAQHRQARRAAVCVMAPTLCKKRLRTIADFSAGDTPPTRNRHGPACRRVVRPAAERM